MGITHEAREVEGLEEAVNEAVALAEKRAEKICESCGVEAESVQLRTGGWIILLCDNCQEQRKLEEEERNRQRQQRQLARQLRLERRDSGVGVDIG